MKPLVSLCVPTRNRAAMLEATFASIAGQQYDPLEIIISDNASDDGTEAVGRSLAAADPRVRYVRHATNVGLYGNHNFCLDESRGEFICFFHDHDGREPSLVPEYVEFMRQYPEVGVVGSDWKLLDEDGRVIGVRRHDVPRITPGIDYISRTIRSGQSSIGVPGAMIRREALGAIRFDEQGAIGFGDFVVWFEIAEHWSIGHLNREVWSWRQEPHSQSARTIESLVHDYHGNLNRYCDGHLARWPGHVRLAAGWRRQINRYLFWALAYELGLHYRHHAAFAAAEDKTLFEILDYRLTPEAFDRTLRQLRTFRTGIVQHCAFAAMMLLVRMRLTLPLAWATQYRSAAREILGLR